MNHTALWYPAEDTFLWGTPLGTIKIWQAENNKEFSCKYFLKPRNSWRKTHKSKSKKQDSQTKSSKGKLKSWTKLTKQKPHPAFRIHLRALSQYRPVAYDPRIHQLSHIPTCRSGWIEIPVLRSYVETLYTTVLDESFYALLDVILSSNFSSS